MSQAILTIHRIKSRRWFKLLVILIIPFLCLISCYQLLRGCLYWTCVPDRDFSVLELSIPEEYFPQGAIIPEMHYTHELEGSLEHGIMTIYWHSGDGLTVYNVWRFASGWKAGYFYNYLNRMEDEFETCPEALRYESIFADQYVLSCGWSRFGGYRADLVARYEEFVISINSVIDEEMSFEEFKRIITYVDEDFGKRLNP